MKDFFKKIIIPACIYFTAITVIFSLIIFAIYGREENGGVLSSLRVFLTFVFSLIFATANSIVRSASMSFPARLFIHAVLTGLGFWLCMLLPLGMEAPQILMGMFIFLIIYAAGLVIALLTNSKIRGKKQNESDYTPIFKKNDK